MSSKPLLWIGSRSYAIYLWHWVIFQVTRPSADLAGETWAIDCARVLLVLALADISLRFIETPIRRERVEDWLRGRKYRTHKLQQRHLVIAVTAPLLFLGLFAGASAIALERDHSLQQADQALAAMPTSGVQSGQNSQAHPIWVTGDSIILGSKPKLAQYYPIAEFNARVGRQIGELIQVVTADKTGLENDPVVLDVGNNNHLTATDLHTLLELVASQPKIIVVNTAVPRTYRADNDRLIAEAVAQFPHAVLVDWNTISTNHPEYFQPDGVHLSDLGSTAYVNAIVEALRQS